MAKLPPFAGYCPPGQLRSMSQRLARQAVLAAHTRKAWQQPDAAVPAPVAPARKRRDLTYWLCVVLTIILAPVALLGFVLVGESRDRSQPEAVPLGHTKWYESDTTE